MLYSIVLGNLKSLPNEWIITEDSYKNSFMTNEAIHQRIRFGKKIPVEIKINYSSVNAKCFNLPEKVMIRNNNKSFGLTMLNYWNSDEEKIKEYIPDQLAYITLNSESYKILDYYTLCEGQERSYCSIVQTYRKKGSYQGCAIRFKENSDFYFEIWAKDLKLNRFVIITLTIDVNGRMKVSKETEIPKALLTKFKKLSKKYSEKDFHFKVEFNDDGAEGFLSKTYIVSKEYYEETKEKLKNVQGCKIIVMESSHFDKNLDEESAEKIHKTLEETIVSGGIRVITLKGLKVPPTFCREYNITYLFGTNLDTDDIYCIKSN